MNKIILSLSLVVVILSCACETAPNYTRIVKFNSFNSDNQLTGHTTVKYNALGLVMRMDIYNTNTNIGTNELNFSSTIEYDSANRVIRENIYSSNGLLESYTLHKRDDSTGRTMRREYYNSNNEMMWYQAAEYLDNGLKAVIRSYDTNNVSIFSNIHEYNSAFKTIKIEACDDRGCYTSFEYEYVGNQLLGWTQYFPILLLGDLEYSSNGVSTYQTYGYDSANRLERIDVFSSTSNLTRYDTFEYEDILADSEFIRQTQSGLYFTYWYKL